MQTLMNVLKTQQVATRHVQTLLAATRVPVAMDTVPALLIATSVLVSISGVHSVSFLPRICSQRLCSLCVDVNECSTGNGGCSHACTNTIGSYYCSCDPGYRLGDNRLRCHSELMECIGWSSQHSVVYAI